MAPTAVFAATEDWARGGDSTPALAERIDRDAGELAELVSGRPPAHPVDPFDNHTPFELLSGM